MQVVYEGVTYVVADPKFGHGISKVVLPDKRVLHINHWLTLEDSSVTPISCEKVDHGYWDFSPAEIARRVGYCCVAVAV